MITPDMVIATYAAEAPANRVTRAQSAASNRGAMFWIGRPALGQPRYFVTADKESDALQVLRVVAAVDDALGISAPRGVPGGRR